MKKAVIYARYSCDRQTEQSIEGQMRVCNEFVKQNDYEVIRCYIDRAMSGTNDNREEFQKMLKDSANKQFEYVIVYKLDRFSRNRYDSAVNKAALKKNGVKVLSATEQITDTPEGIILEAMLEGFAEYYSAELSQKVKRGLVESWNKGLFTGGFVNFGYKIVDKKWTIVEREAKIVRKIFNYYADGMPMKAVCEKINNSKPVKEIGRTFTVATIARMLNNKRYIGIVEGDRIYDDIIPAIVDKNLFVQVRAVLDNHKHRSAHFKAKDKYLLSGKLYCRDCGALMTAETGKGKTGKVYRYYKCVNRKLYRTCQCGAPSKPKLEKLVIDKILEFINDETLYTKIEKHYTEIKKYSKKDSYAKLNREKKQIKNIIELHKNASTTNESQAYKMINDLVDKIVYIDDRISIYLNFMDIELVTSLE